MTIKDRGTIKWVSLMLPEHQAELQKLLRRNHIRQKPILDEQELLRLDRLFRRAIAENLRLQVLYYQNQRFHYLRGRVQRRPGERNKLLLSGADREQVLLDISEILGASVVSDGGPRERGGNTRGENP